MSEHQAAEPIKKIAAAVHQAARAESAPAPVRRYRAVLFRGALIVVAGAFALLTAMVKTMPSLEMDLKTTKALQLLDAPAFGLLMNLTSWPGFGPQSVIIVGLVILLLYALGLHWETVMATLAAVLSTAINVLVKDLIHRPRPTPDLVSVFAKVAGYSFPSGHVMFYIVFFGFIWFLTFTLLKPSLKRSLILVFLGCLIALVGVSRIYLGEHWASDVLGSYLLGTLTLTAIIQFYLWGKTRYFLHQPAAPA